MYTLHGHKDAGRKSHIQSNICIWEATGSHNNMVALSPLC